MFASQANLIIRYSWFPVQVQLGRDATLWVQTASRVYVYDKATHARMEQWGSIPWESFSSHRYLTMKYQPMVVVELADGGNVRIQPLHPEEFMSAVNGTIAVDVP